MSSHTKLKFLNDYLYTVWYEQDLSIINDIFSDDAVLESPISTLDMGAQAKTAISLTWLSGLDKTGVRVTKATCNDNSYFINWHCWGRHSGELFGIKESGELLNFTGKSWYTFGRDDKIVKYKSVVDFGCLIGDQGIMLNDVRLQALETKLTPVRVKQLALWALNKPRALCGDCLGVSEETVKSHRKYILQTLGVNKNDLINYLTQVGALEPLTQYANKLLFFKERNDMALKRIH